MRSFTFLIPGDLESRTGGYGYDRRLIEELRALGWSIDVRVLDGTYPMPTERARRDTAAMLAECVDDRLVLVDGLAFGGMAEEAERERDRLRLVALVHHPLANETGIGINLAHALEATERRALACTRAVVVTSRSTVHSLGWYGVPRERIVVVEPGTDPGPLARGSQSSTCSMLCVASVTPRKGHETLLRALAELKDLDWRLTCVGSVDRAPDTAARVRQLAVSEGLQARVEFRGELGEGDVARCYDASDLFVLATFHEGYGMVVAEAIARCIPVVATPTGAIPELLGEDAGGPVPPGDVPALASALRRVMTDETMRTRLREGALRRRMHLPSWRDAAATMAAALSNV